MGARPRGAGEGGAGIAPAARRASGLRPGVRLVIYVCGGEGEGGNGGKGDCPTNPHTCRPPSAVCFFCLTCVLRAAGQKVELQQPHASVPKAAGGCCFWRTFGCLALNPGWAGVRASRAAAKDAAGRGLGWGRRACVHARGGRCGLGGARVHAGGRAGVRAFAGVCVLCVCACACAGPCRRRSPTCMHARTYTVASCCARAHPPSLAPKSEQAGFRKLRECFKALEQAPEQRILWGEFKSKCSQIGLDPASLSVKEVGQSPPAVPRACHVPCAPARLCALPRPRPHYSPSPPPLLLPRLAAAAPAA